MKHIIVLFLAALVFTLAEVYPHTSQDAPINSHELEEADGEYDHADVTQLSDEEYHLDTPQSFVDVDQGVSRRRRRWRWWRPAPVIQTRVHRVQLPPTYKHVPLNQALKNQYAKNQANRRKHLADHRNAQQKNYNNEKVRTESVKKQTKAQVEAHVKSLKTKLDSQHKKRVADASRKAKDAALKEGQHEFDDIVKHVEVAVAKAKREKQRAESWMKDAQQAKKDATVVKNVYTPILKNNEKASAKAQAAVNEFIRESESLKKELAELQKVKAEVERKAREAPKAVTARMHRGRDARSHPGFKPEADGSRPKTRTMELGKNIDPSVHGKYLIKDSFKADFKSINNADILNGAAKESSQNFRNEFADIILSATYSGSPTKVEAEGVVLTQEILDDDVPSKKASFLESEVTETVGDYDHDHDHDQDYGFDYDHANAEDLAEEEAALADSEEFGIMAGADEEADIAHSLLETSRRRRRWRWWRPRVHVKTVTQHIPGPVITVDPNVPIRNHEVNDERNYHRQLQTLNTKHRNEMEHLRKTHANELKKLQQERHLRSKQISQEYKNKEIHAKKTMPKKDKSEHIARMNRAKSTKSANEKEARRYKSIADQNKRVYHKVSKEIDSVTADGDSKIKTVETEAELLTKGVKKSSRIINKLADKLANIEMELP